RGPNCRRRLRPAVAAGAQRGGLGTHTGGHRRTPRAAPAGTDMTTTRPDTTTTTAASTTTTTTTTTTRTAVDARREPTRMAAAQAPSRRDPLWRRVRSALSNPGVLFSLIWQIFLVYPVMAVLSADAPAGLTVLGLVAVVSFSVAYVVAFASPAASDDFPLDLRDRRPGGRPVSLGLGHLAVLVLCAFGTAPAAGANSVVAFLPFLACFLTAAWPLRWSVPACAGLVAAGVGAA